MGQLNEKCSMMFCDNKKVNDKQENFENIFTENTNKIEAKVEQFLDMQGTISPITTYGNLIRESIIRMDSQCMINRPLSFMNDSSVVSFVLPVDKIIAYMRGHLFRRKKFQTLKLELEMATNEIFQIFENLYKSEHILKVEAKFGQFNKDGYLKHYKATDKQFTTDVNLYYVRILVISGCYYSGYVDINYKRNGYGILLKKNGKKYEGNWINNAFTGWGRFIDPDSNIYEGYFEKGLLNGKGERRNLQGNYYIGDFVKGQRHGIGTEEYTDFTYSGEYRNDKKEGKGKLTYTLLKDVYEGEFRLNAINGYGLYIWANKDIYEGTFKDGKMHGSGKYKWPDGCEYVGEYVNGIKQGMGRFRWTNGKIFDGPFYNGKPHGFGKLIAHENVFDAEFREGKMVNSESKREDTSESTQTYTPNRFRRVNTSK
jgi:hypothetical protein